VGYTGLNTSTIQVSLRNNKRRKKNTMFGFTFGGEKIDSKSCGIDFDIFGIIK